ncbi:YIP1 family protein [Vibrio tapetis subsp. quintayensis]|uniref:YIP1 family protein n=1 Tax=Vibrio tapetis TaxID=52443 RepID=UPI0025B48DC6|nr:YIP1 family protein [Vibrio tapetis]MDN3682694.1 YIP1 family protein [Vibrio tapetis subsp. quintayensis]
MTPSSNPFAMLLDIFRAPTACFAALYQRGMWGWWPYLILILSPFAFWGSYFDLVNFAWLKAELVIQMSEVAPDQIKLIDANTMLATEVIRNIAGRSFTILLLAFWFKLATQGSQVQISYWKWFAVSSVILFPAIIGDFASYVSVLLKHGQVMSYAADLNSLNGLLKLPLTSEWSTFARSFPLLMPWYIVLGYAALGALSTIEKGQALVISALPWVGYFLCWAIILLVS